jgi:hypothetical protein
MSMTKLKCLAEILARKIMSESDYFKKFILMRNKAFLLLQFFTATRFSDLQKLPTTAIRKGVKNSLIFL